MDNNGLVSGEYFEALEKIKNEITKAQHRVLTTANVEKNLLYWNIGRVILEHGTWGNKFVENLSKDLRMAYPGTQGYSVRNLNYMKQFATRVKSEEILQQVGAKINWRTIKALIDKTETTEEYIWYAEQCLENGWSSTVLVHQVESKLYDRQALAIKTTNFQENLLAPLGEQAEEILKDPYVFDFIPNAKQMKETDLENALVE